MLTLALIQGPALNINVADGHITITAPAAMTDAELRAAVNSDGLTKPLIEALQDQGDGTDAITFQPVTEFVAARGLLQSLQQEFELADWADRDLRTVQEMKALLWPARIEVESDAPTGFKRYVARCQAGIATTNKEAFESQNIQLLQLGRRLDYRLRRFKAENLTGISVIATAITNRMRIQTGEKVEILKSAHLRALCEFEVRYKQPANLKPEDNPAILGVDFGLWRQTIDVLPETEGSKLMKTFRVEEL